LTLWWPDYYKVTSEVKLDPSLTPMQNCWRIIDIQVSIWLNAYKIFAYTEDRMIDLEQSARVAVYSELLRRVRKGLYDPGWSFYYNVRSCAWSCMQRVIKQWRNQDIIHANELDGNALIDDCPSDHSSMTFFDMVATESVPRLRTNSELYCYKITDWHDARTQASKTRVLNEQVDDEYSRYCEDCEELGVKPADKVTFVCNSYTAEEHEQMKYAPPKRTMYNRKYIQKLRSDPVRLERKRAYDRAYHAKRKAEREAQKQK
jgi:hypothetical protein